MIRTVEMTDVASSLIVEVEKVPSSGVFEPTDELQFVEAYVSSDDGPNRATLRYLYPSECEASLAKWSRWSRIAVRAAGAEGDRYLFCGLPGKVEWRYRGDGGRGEADVIVTVQGISEVLRTLPGQQVYGRYCRVREAVVAGTEQVGLVTALACIFNPAGLPNCDPQPITVSLSGGQVAQVHVFTHDDDPDAEPWTAVRALRYLAWFYLRQSGLVDVASFLVSTESAAAETPSDVEYLRSKDLLRWGLLARLNSLSGEGMSAADVLDAVCGSYGLHWHVGISSGDSGPVCQFEIWAENEGEVLSLFVGQGHSTKAPDGGRERAEAVLRATVSRNLEAGPDKATVVGDVKYHEVTVELVPGWSRISGVDDVPEDERDQVKAEALLPEDVEALGDAVNENKWFQYFHRKGVNFLFFQDVGRKWVLNEHGEYDGLWYNRYQPFDNYEPFDFSKVLSSDVATTDNWSVRRRRFLDPVTTSAEGQRLPIMVEVSFDGGQNWFQYTGPLRVLRDECGIILDVDNLCEIVPPGKSPREDNFWYALIDQRARVRVTATIEGDERVVAEAYERRDGRCAVEKLVYAARELRFRSAAGAVNSLRSEGLSGADVDDREQARAIAESEVGQGRDYEVSVEMAGIRPSVALGQRLLITTREGLQSYEAVMGRILPVVRRIRFVGGVAGSTTIIAR